MTRWQQVSFQRAPNTQASSLDGRQPSTTPCKPEGGRCKSVFFEGAQGVRVLVHDLFVTCACVYVGDVGHDVYVWVYTSSTNIFNLECNVHESTDIHQAYGTFFVHGCNIFVGRHMWIYFEIVISLNQNSRSRAANTWMIFFNFQTDFFRSVRLKCVFINHTLLLHCYWINLSSSKMSAFWITSTKSCMWVNSSYT